MAGSAVVSTEDFLGSQPDVQPSGRMMDTNEFFSEQPKEQSLASKVWKALTIPEKMSRLGLQKLASMVPGEEPTGNMVKDIALNTPKILAETLAEVAPSFVSRGSLATSGVLGALKATSPVVAPLVKGGLKGLGAQLESSAGISPKGSLNAAYNDASTMFAKGTGAAKSLYESAKAEMPVGTNLFDGMWKPEQIVEKAQEILANGGKIEPSEALTARKAVDVLSKSGRYIKDELFKLRDTFDEIAKGSEKIAEADPLHLRGLRAEALRNLLPQNKLGGTSPFKVAVGKALGVASAPILSPVLQGTAATLAGLAGRYGVEPLVENPTLGALLAAVAERNKR